MNNVLVEEENKFNYRMGLILSLDRGKVRLMSLLAP